MLEKQAVAFLASPWETAGHRARSQSPSFLVLLGSQSALLLPAAKAQALGSKAQGKGEFLPALARHATGEGTRKASCCPKAKSPIPQTPPATKTMSV